MAMSTTPLATMAVAIVVGCAALFGVLNGLLVEIAAIDSFIATLGTGTVVYAVAMWHSGGRQVVGELLDGHPVQSVKLKEVLGHTPLQVAAGAVLGVLFGIFYPAV